VTWGWTCSASPRETVADGACGPEDVGGLHGRGALAFLFVPRRGEGLGGSAFPSRAESGACFAAAGALRKEDSLASAFQIWEVAVCGGPGRAAYGSGASSSPEFSPLLSLPFFAALLARRAAMGLTRALANSSSTSCMMALVQSSGPYSQKNLFGTHPQHC
jgi:hypothetical protein